MKNTKTLILEGYPKIMSTTKDGESPVIVFCERTNKKFPYVIITLKTGILETMMNIYPLKQTTPRTIEDGLEVGDIVIDGEDTRKVLATCGKGILLSEDNNYDKAYGWYTLQEILYHNYTLQQPEEPSTTVKMTVKEVSKLVGKTVEIIE